jgi:hypothetical protein
MADEIFKMYEIDGLIDSDQQNVAETKRALLSVDKNSLDATDESFGLLENIGILFGKAADYDRYNQQLNDWLKTRRGTAEENVRFLQEGTLIGHV